MKVPCISTPKSLYQGSKQHGGFCNANRKKMIKNTHNLQEILFCNGLCNNKVDETNNSPSRLTPTAYTDGNTRDAINGRLNIYRIFKKETTLYQ